MIPNMLPVEMSDVVVLSSSLPVVLVWTLMSKQFLIKLDTRKTKAINSHLTYSFSTSQTLNDLCELMRVLECLGHPVQAGQQWRGAVLNTCPHPSVAHSNWCNLLDRKSLRSPFTFTSSCKSIIRKITEISPQYLNVPWIRNSSFWWSSNISSENLTLVR